MERVEMFKKKHASAFVVWSAFGLCTAVSVTFNGLHTALETSSPIRLSMGAVWPVMAVLAVELLTRVPFPKGMGWTLARYGGVGTVAVGAMVISYMHTFHVLVVWGEPLLAAAVGPLVVDGLMALSGAALLAMHAPKPTRRRRRPAARKPRLVKASPAAAVA